MNRGQTIYIRIILVEVFVHFNNEKKLEILPPLSFNYRKIVLLIENTMA